MTHEGWIQFGIGVATFVASGITIWAILEGPKQALRIQRQLDEARETKNRKLGIFKTLMSFRATKLSPQFVQALNLIDVEFVDDSEKPIRDSWKELWDHYTDMGRQTPEQNEANNKTNIERAEELLADILVKMGHSLGYKFMDKVYVKKSCYYPMGLGNIEDEQHALRKAALKLLAGQSKLPVAVFEETFKPITVKVEPAVNALRSLGKQPL